MTQVTFLSSESLTHPNSKTKESLNLGLNNITIKNEIMDELKLPFRGGSTRTKAPNSRQTIQIGTKP